MPPPRLWERRACRQHRLPTTPHQIHSNPLTRAALEGRGPRRRPQRRLGRRLEEVAESVGGGYCRLQMPLRRAVGVRGTVAGHRLGALGGDGVPAPASNALFLGVGEVWLRGSIDPPPPPPRDPFNNSAPMGGGWVPHHPPTPPGPPSPPIDWTRFSSGLSANQILWRRRRRLVEAKNHWALPQHGSIPREIRYDIKFRLKAGKVPAVVVHWNWESISVASIWWFTSARLKVSWRHCGGLVAAGICCTPRAKGVSSLCIRLIWTRGGEGGGDNWTSRKQKRGETCAEREGEWAAKTADDPRTHQHNPQCANYRAPLPRTRHHKEHRPQRSTERSDPMQHAKGRTDDCPGPRKESATRGTVTQGGLDQICH